MDHLYLYEGFFRKEKETEVQKEISKSQISKGNIRNKIEEYLKSKESVLTYRRLHKSFLYQQEGEIDIYYGKMLSSFRNCCSIIYQLSRVKDIVEGIDLNKEFEFLSNFYVKRGLYTTTPACKYMFQATYYLNQIHSNLFGSDYSEEDIFYVDCDPVTKHCSFRNREKDNEMMKIHKVEDPYGEEKWGD